MIVPDYKAIQGSKFASVDGQISKMNVLKQSKTKPSSKLAEITQNNILKANVMNKTIRIKNVPDHKTVNYGGSEMLSKGGGISLTFDDWENWGTFLKEKKAKQGKTSKPVLPKNAE